MNNYEIMWNKLTAYLKALDKSIIGDNPYSKILDLMNALEDANIKKNTNYDEKIEIVNISPLPYKEDEEEIVRIF